MTVVVDTNVIVAALVANGLCREVLHRAIRLRLLVTSDALLAELETTLRDKFELTPSASAFLDLFRASTRVVRPHALPAPVCRDSTDDVVLATAVAASADLIVTGDNDLLVLKWYARIRIPSPRAFLEGLDRLGSGDVVDRQFFWGLSNGAIVLVVGGFFWLGLAMSASPPTQPFFLVLVAASAWLMFRAFRMRRKARGFSPSELATADERERLETRSIVTRLSLDLRRSGRPRRHRRLHLHPRGTSGSDLAGDRIRSSAFTLFRSAACSTSARTTRRDWPGPFCLASSCLDSQARGRSHV